MRHVASRLSKDHFSLNFSIEDGRYALLDVLIIHTNYSGDTAVVVEYFTDIAVFQYR